MRWRPVAQEATRDEASTTLAFVDVLFAIVVAEIVTSFHSDDLTGATAAQLVLAGVTTMLSYVAYRESRNRMGYDPRPLANLPFWHFVVDVGLVYLYFRLATLTEGPLEPPSAVGEAATMTLIFLLYWVWDLLARRMRRSSSYPNLRDHPGQTRRETVTVVFFWLSVGTLVAISALTLDTTRAVVVADVVLVVLTVAYRYVKEVVDAPHDAGAPAGG